MKKDIRDYLHLYMGCNCILPDFSEKINNIKFKLTAYNYNYYKDWHSEIQPILRPLSSMTEEEAIELAKLSEWEPHFRDVKVNRNNFGDLIVSWDGMTEGGETFNATGELSYTSEQFQWLLKNRFDLFHLIEDGLALDSTKQPAQ